MTPAEDWERGAAASESIVNLRQICPRDMCGDEYVCDCAGSDDADHSRRANNPDAAVFGRIGSVLKPDSKTDKQWEWDCGDT